MDVVIAVPASKVRVAVEKLNANKLLGLISHFSVDGAEIKTIKISVARSVWEHIFRSLEASCEAVLL